MWMDEQISKLKKKISDLSDEELLKMVEVDFKDYRKEALEFAKDELTRRGIEFGDANKRSPEKAREDAAARTETCSRCGGEARPGVLVDYREIIIVFTDKNEQRFVEVYACSRCGHVQMVVDFETEIEHYERIERTKGDENESEAKYRCPQCGWEPDAEAEWYCDKCGHYWNTFETHGRCPKCNYQWTKTACDNCGELSDHEAWYVKAKQGE
jgi:hypothetical protein